MTLEAMVALKLTTVVVTVNVMGNGGNGGGDSMQASSLRS
jgi:hypothetical protein